VSKYYTTCTTDKGSATRAGRHWARATAQSYDGSIIVEIQDDNFEVFAAPGSQDSPSAGRSILKGKLSETCNTRIR